jgi:hypothetical protein
MSFARAVVTLVVRRAIAVVDAGNQADTAFDADATRVVGAAAV